MHDSHHLQLRGNKLTNDGLQAILDGCPHLESLDLRGCFHLKLGGELGRRCAERIKKPCNLDNTEGKTNRHLFYQYRTEKVEMAEYHFTSTRKEGGSRRN
ncbi:unnamed protein product [Prunus armeniaca]|uniref:COI1 F-box domain-containing protein n=1 Tax=Prunus armeniaca TaxID=36596 RepID=A0A6J5X742_PRUAR|nr:unnamed protein product [Prunus armeniaca]